ncbi:restriction endonuclease subunit S [Bifidobacterium pseudocatenulatum]|uniref:restriction endonuclease subunit S n=1 Tax=Bifidobacterium pseudocatenulatum TaxID=28026 RepID=UPI000E42E8C1|nr:restriction endonuclease subunit S [Bifidobacterium pseudocatenulatum]RGJ82710.1 restriction endonuclease subunit S [Bifidobacterium pseudocatenulatum]
MSWRETTLGEITDLKRGFDLPKSQRLQGDVPVYSSSGITGSNSTAAAEGPCVITGRYGTIGEVFFSGGPCWPLNTALYSTEFNGNNPRFVYYLLQTIPWQGYTTASAVPGVNRNHVNLCPVKIPDRATQDAIVEVLDSIVDKIALNNRLNDYLLDLLKSSAKNLYLKHEKNIQEKLPSGWRWVSIGEIADMVCRGIAPKYSLESDEIILGQTCIRNNLVLTENGRSHAPKKLTDKWLRKYDLLINSTGVGSLGRTAQVWFEPSKLVVDSHVTIVRATDKKNALYLGSWAFEHERYIESLHTGSTGQTELPRDRVKAIRVVLPDAGTLDEFNAIAEPSVKMIVANQEENKRLIEIRDTLLPKLMSGAIDVSKVDLTQLTNNHLADC